MSTTLQPGSWLPLPELAVPPQHLFSFPVVDADKMFMRFIISEP